MTKLMPPNLQVTLSQQVWYNVYLLTNLYDLNLQWPHHNVQLNMCYIIKCVDNKFQRHTRFVLSGGLIRWKLRLWIGSKTKRAKLISITQPHWQQHVTRQCHTCLHTGQKTLFPSDRIWTLLQKIVKNTILWAHNRIPYLIFMQNTIK